MITGATGVQLSGDDVSRVPPRVEESTGPLRRWRPGASRDGGGGATPKPVVHRITGARRSLSEDIQSRQVRYVISMGIRTICFLLAVITGGWLRILFFAGAVVLPYLAVVFANAGREQAQIGPDAVAPPLRPGIEPRRDGETWPPLS